MLSMALITDSDCDNCRPPVPHKSLGSSIEYRFTADDLGSGAVYLTEI